MERISGGRSLSPFAGRQRPDVLRPCRLEQAMGSGEHVKRRGQREPETVHASARSIPVRDKPLDSPYPPVRIGVSNSDAHHVLCDERCERTSISG